MPAKLFKKKAKTKNSYVSPISGTTRSILSDSTLPRIRDYDYQNANHNFARRPVKKQAPGQSADEDGTSRRASPGGPDVNEEVRTSCSPPSVHIRDLSPTYIFVMLVASRPRLP
jgi:hypothetical protein